MFVSSNSDPPLPTPLPQDLFGPTRNPFPAQNPGRDRLVAETGGFGKDQHVQWLQVFAKTESGHDGCEKMNHDLDDVISLAH
jgi:hypothetical protein